MAEINGFNSSRPETVSRTTMAAHVFPAYKDNTIRADIFAITFIVLHALGLVLLILNAIYLKCTRGHGSVRAGRRFGEYRRPCKVRSVVACNILIIYHTILMTVELVITVFGQARFLSLFFMVLFLGSYVVLICCCVPFLYQFCEGLESRVGPANGYNVLESFNFILFWICFIVLASCRVSFKCSSLPPDFRIFGGRFTLVVAAIAYIGLLCGSIYHYKHRFNNYRKRTSKTEAVRIVKEKVDEAPSVRWTVICGHNEDTGGEGGSSFVATCNAVKTYNFPNTQVDQFTNLKQHPSEAMFTKMPTKLKISMSLIVGEDAQKDLRTFKENIKMEHDGHDGITKIKTQSRIKENYFVCDSASTPLDFHWAWLVFFTLVGLSMPYRWYLYCRTGHLKVKIKKYVLKSLPNDGGPPNPARPTLTPTPATPPSPFSPSPPNPPNPPTPNQQMPPMGEGSVCIEMEKIPINEKHVSYT